MSSLRIRFAAAWSDMLGRKEVVAGEPHRGRWQVSAVP